MKKRYTDEQIIKFLKEADCGVSVKELCLSVMQIFGVKPLMAAMTG